MQLNWAGLCVVISVLWPVLPVNHCYTVKSQNCQLSAQNSSQMAIIVKCETGVQVQVHFRGNVRCSRVLLLPERANLARRLVVE